MPPTPAAVAAGAALARWLDEPPQGPDPDERDDVEPDWQGQAAAVREFLKSFADGEPPRQTERAAIARAFDVLLGERYRRLRALRVTEQWIRTGRDGGVDALMAQLRRLAPEITKSLTVKRRHVDALLGRNATGVRQGRDLVKTNATRAAGRKTAAPAVLARIALLSGAFGIEKTSEFSDDDVKREAAKFRSAREKPIAKKKTSGRKASKKPNRKERDR